MLPEEKEATEFLRDRGWTPGEDFDTGEAIEAAGSYIIDTEIPKSALKKAQVKRKRKKQ